MELNPRFDEIYYKGVADMENKDIKVDEEIYARSVRQYFKGQKPVENKGLRLIENVKLRMEFATVLHKALRQFEVEGCPEVFDMKVHIDQLLSKVLKAGYVKLDDWIEEAGAIVLTSSAETDRFIKDYAGSRGYLSPAEVEAKIEEAKRLAFEDGYTKGQQRSIGTDAKLVEEAKKQERERIITEIEKHKLSSGRCNDWIYHVNLDGWWLSLKANKGDGY